MQGKDFHQVIQSNQFPSAWRTEWICSDIGQIRGANLQLPGNLITLKRLILLRVTFIAVWTKRGMAKVQRLLGTYITCCAQFGSSTGHGSSSGCTTLSVPPTTAQLTFLYTTRAHQFLWHEVEIIEIWLKNKKQFKKKPKNIQKDICCKAKNRKKN